MRFFTAFLTFFFLTVSIADAQNKFSYSAGTDSTMPSLGSAAGGAIGTVLAKADVALCKSIIYPAHLRGDSGESLMGKFHLENLLSRGGNWELLSHQFGRQGIDGIFIKFDGNGNPRGLIVAESKYGNSQLGMTEDGRQMSAQWIDKRLAKLAKHYKEVAMDRPSFAKYPSNGKRPSHKIEVKLNNGKKAVFWRNNSQDTWKYDGPPGTIEEAQKKASKTATYLDGAAKGKITYRTRLFRFKLDGDILKVSVGDPSKMTNSGKVPVTDTYEIKLSGLKKADYVKAIQKDIAKQIRSKFPHISEKEALSQAKKITDNAKNLQEMVEASRKALAKSLAMSTVKASAIGALLAGGLEGISQLISEGKIDFSEVGKQLSLGGISAGSGALAGQATVIFLTKSQLGYNSMLRLSSALNLPTASIGANLLGAWVGGALASAVFSYGNVFTGGCDWAEANRMAATGVIATTSGVLASSATMSAAVAFGTASTGTAVSSLSGAAASNAALAWLGGGATSAGGFGMAGGAMVLGSVVTVTVVAVSAATTYVYYVYDQHQEDKRNIFMMDYLLTNNSFLHKVCNNSSHRDSHFIAKL